MRKVSLAITAAAMLAALGLAACNSEDVSTNVQTTIEQIQKTTETVCGFLPVATTVTGVIGTLSNNTDTAEVVNAAATAICSTVMATKNEMKPGATPSDSTDDSWGAYKGVEIKGKFVK